MLISIVIPYFNEKKNLEILIPNLKKSLNKIRKCKFEVIFVDDCSTDKSSIVVKLLIKDTKFVKFRIMRLLKKSGQTGAFKAAFQKAKGKFIIRMDADLQNDPRDISKFINKINLRNDLVIGKRVHNKQSILLYYCGELYNKIMRLILIKDIKNYSSSFVAFNKKYLKKLPWFHNDHRYLPSIVIERGAINISEVNVNHCNRRFGKSNYNTFKKIILGFPEIVLFLIRLKLGFYSIK